MCDITFVVLNVQLNSNKPTGVVVSEDVVSAGFVVVVVSAAVVFVSVNVVAGVVLVGNVVSVEVVADSVVPVSNPQCAQCQLELFCAKIRVIKESAIACCLIVLSYPPNY